MIGWYLLFIGAVLVLCAFASPRDRIALRIVLIASIFSTLIKYGITQQIEGAWKLVFPGAIEAATFCALLHWARNKTGAMQAACVFVEFQTHLVCYLDLILRTNVIYDHYEVVIGLISLAKVACFYDTGRHNFPVIVHWTKSILRRGVASEIHPYSLSRERQP